MAVSFVKSDKNASGGTITAIQAGDVVLVYAFRSGSNSTPTLPAGWTSLNTVVTNSAGSLCAYQIATGTSLVTGTFTNATNCVFEVYRGVDQTTTIGDHKVSTGTGTAVTYPALTMVNSSGSSWVAGLGGHRSTNTTIDTAPTGMTNRDSQITTGEVGVHDTNGGVTSWSAVSPSVGGTSSGWGCYSVELLAAATSTNYTQSLSGTLSFTGAQSKSIGYPLTAALSYGGAIARNTAHNMTAAISFVGAALKASTRSLPGILSFFVSTTNYNTPARIQNSNGSPVNSGSTQNVQPLSNVNLGDTFILTVAVDANVAVSTVTDSAGNTWARAVASAQGGITAENVEIWYAKITAGGGTRPTVTITMASSTNFNSVLRIYSNIAGLDVTATNADTTNQTTQSTGTTAATTVATELVFAAAEMRSGSSVYTISAGSGYSDLNAIGTLVSGTFAFMPVEANVVTTTGTQTATFTTSQSANYVAAIATFKATTFETGGLLKRTGKPFTGGLSFTGAFKRATSHILTAVLSFAGGLSTFKSGGGNSFSQPLTAGLSFTGNQSKSIVHKMTATLSFSGSHLKQAGKKVYGWLTGDRTDYAIYMDSTPTGVVSGVINSPASTTTDITIGCWMKASNAGANTAVTQSFLRYRLWRLHIRGGVINLRYDETAAHVATKNIPNDGNPHLVVGTYDWTGGTNNTMFVYVDGSQSTASNNTLLPSSTYNATGWDAGHGATAYDFSGAIQQVVIWHRAVSSAEVSAWYSSGTIPASPYAQFNLQEGSGTSVADSSGNGHPNATLGANAWWGPGFITAPQESIAIRQFYGRIFTAAVSFAGTMNRNILHLLTASANFTGVFAKSISYPLTATTSFAGVISRRIGKTLLATASFTGIIKRGITHIFTGAVSFTGAITALKNGGASAFTQAFTAGLSFVGNQGKVAGKALPAAITFRVASFTATPSLRQSRIINNGGPTTSQPVQFNADTISASAILVAIQTNDSTVSVTSVTDTTGNSYSKVGDFRAATTGAYLALYAAVNITGGTRPTVTINYNGLGVGNNIEIMEYTGLASTIANLLDAVSPGDEAAAAPITSTAINASAPNDLLLALGVNNNSSASFTVGSGYTHFNSIFFTGRTFAVEDQILGAPGLATASFNQSASQQAAILLFALRADSNSLVKKISRSLSAANSFNGALIKRTARALAAALSFTGNALRQIGRAFTGALSANGVISRLIGHTATATLAFSGIINRQINRALAATASLAGAFKKNPRRSLAASVSFSGSASRTIRRSMTAATSFAGSIATLVKRLSVFVPSRPLHISRKNSTLDLRQNPQNPLEMGKNDGRLHLGQNPKTHLEDTEIDNNELYM
jgi:hypothetical protein